MSRVVWAMPLLLALAAPLAAQAAPDRLEELLWQGAANANSVPAYDTYLRRYPAGAHAADARAALDKLGILPAPADAAPPVAAPASAPAPATPPLAVAPASPPPAPPSPALPTVVVPPASVAVAQEPAAAASPLFLCRPAYAAGAVALDRVGEAELAAYLQALRVSSLAAYQHYLDAYPQGAFAPAVASLVRERAARARTLAATPVPGPVAAKLRHPIVPGAGDYPAEAKGARGKAVAVWEIGEDGCVQSCRIETSSGSPALDNASCRIATAQGRYDPARDAAGTPIRSIGGAALAWAAPAR